MERTNTTNQKNEGEGSRTADADYVQRTKEYLEDNDPTADAKTAKSALDGPEGAELRAAEAAGKAGGANSSRTALDRINEEVARLRDEAKLEVNLAKKEVRDRLVELDHRWNDAQAKLMHVRAASSDAAKDVKASLEDTLVQLRDGYRKVKDSMA